MSDLENIKWLLNELSLAEDIESNDLEICGEDDEGVDGCFTEQITVIAEKALKQITELQERLKAADEVISVISNLIDDSQELNMPNYDNDEVESLNQAVIDMYKALKNYQEVKK